MKKTWVCWSTGKDSTYTLYTLLQNPEVQVTGLLTTIHQDNETVAMHSTRKELLEKQSEMLGLPLETVPIPQQCVNRVYEEQMKKAMEKASLQGVQQVAFGDLFLEDIRQYRENQMSKTHLKPTFPLWKKSTKELAHDMIDWGAKALITCVDTQQISKEFIGRNFDKEFLKSLPDTVDPCGENGEFHTFVYDCPLFKKPIPIQTGEVVKKDHFVFIDLKLKSAL